jgi:uncharacterized protein YndB with AHSA1/START domain
VTGPVDAHASARDVTVRRTFARPREDVFEAWTDPDALVRWFGGALAQTLSAAVDLRVGGAYRLAMRSGAQVFALEGVYREVEAPERLVYTWRWDGLDIDEGRESLVTVLFRDREGATEVVVTHEGIRTHESLVFHEGGWTASLEQLGELL